MKILIIIILVSIYTSLALVSEPLLAEKWNTFRKFHGRLFRNSREEQFRKTIFTQRLQHIEEHNERYRKGLESYKIGVNQFTDYTDEEMMSYTHGEKIPLQMSESLTNTSSSYSSSLRSVIPSSLDWRDKGAVTPVKNQDTCGSCWAFAATAVLESHLAINFFTVTLSEQQLVDCLNPDWDGCWGGSKLFALRYILTNGGINSDSDYPYEAKFGVCRYQPSKPRAVIKDVVSLPEQDEAKLKEIVATVGPVAASINVNGNFPSYSSGVYNDPTCTASNYNHAVVVVGYGSENGQDYWLVKNSWGSGWGENGYIKMARNQGNQCGIASYIVYPVV